MRGQPGPVQQCEDVVNDVVLGLGEQVGFREGRFRNAGTGIIAAELGDGVVEVLLRAESLSFEYIHNRGSLPHVGDRRFFEGHGVTLGTVVAHGVLSTDSCASRLTQCSTRRCVRCSTAKGFRPYSWPRTQRTITAATKRGC